MNKRLPSARFCLTRLLLRPPGWAAAFLLVSGTLPGFTQPDPGQINSVRLVDTELGQDIEIQSTLPPSSFQPERGEDCTFALVVPNLLPGSEIAGQFFSSELVERLTLRTVNNPSPATRICVKTNVPVRSRVALRASGLTLRLERVREEDDLLGPGESFRPVDEVVAEASLTPPSLDRDRPASLATNALRAQRELELVAREAQVEARELKLEIGQLRRQLSEQVSASADMDQELVRRQGATDQLTPRIERLMRALDVDGNALEQPVERFDAALAALKRRLVDLSASNADFGTLRAAADELVASLHRSGRLVTTNEDVNVRLGPSTDEVRVAFLPKGVLLLVKERRGAWSFVSAGNFEGWIFDELLSSHRGSGQEVGGPAGEDGFPEFGTSAERLRWAGEQVVRLQQELGLNEMHADAGAQRLRELEARQASYETAEVEAQESARSNVVLQSEVYELQARVLELEQESEILLNRVRDTEAERLVAAGDLERVLEGREQDDAGVAGEPSEERLISKLQALASLTDGEQSMVVTTDLTNLRAGPSMDNERLALLPRDFELTLLSEGSGWYEVLYGQLRGWVSADFSRMLDDGAAGFDNQPIDVLLDRVERSLTSGAMQGSGAAKATKASVVEEGQDGERASSESDGGLLQSAADAVYAHSAAARRGDVEAYLSYYSERFVPQEGTREAWEQEVRQHFEKQTSKNTQVQNLALRKVSETLVEARYRSATGDGSIQRMDLLREERGWKVLLETVAVEPGDQE